MKFLKTLCIIIAIIIVFTIVVLNVNEGMNAKVVLTEYTFAHPEVPTSFDGYKIMVISDLHNARFSDMIIEHIENTQPDIIVFTGDMVQLPYDNYSETVKIVRAFADEIPVYAITGNHEAQNEKRWDIVDDLRDEGVTVLVNYSVSIEKDGESILLIGVDDPGHDDVDQELKDEMRENIVDEFPDGQCFSILLNHRADLYPEIKDTGVDLILSGHLHGGIIRLPFLGGIIGKETKGFLPEYDYGYIKEGDSAAMIVSGGCDDNPKKKRYFNPPEVVLISLESRAD